MGKNSAAKFFLQCCCFLQPRFFLARKNVRPLSCCFRRRLIISTFAPRNRKKMLSLTLSLSLFLFLFHTHTHSISLSFSFSSSLSRTHTLTLPPSHFWYCVLPAVKMIAPLSLFDGTHTQAHTQTVFPFSPSFYFKAHSFLKALTLNLLPFLSLSPFLHALTYFPFYEAITSLFLSLFLSHTHTYTHSLFPRLHITQSRHISCGLLKCRNMRPWVDCFV